MINVNARIIAHRFNQLLHNPDSHRHTVMSLHLIIIYRWWVILSVLIVDNYLSSVNSKIIHDLLSIIIYLTSLLFNKHMFKPAKLGPLAAAKSRRFKELVSFGSAWLGCRGSSRQGWFMTNFRVVSDIVYCNLQLRCFNSFSSQRKWLTTIVYNGLQWLIMVHNGLQTVTSGLSMLGWSWLIMVNVWPNMIENSSCACSPLHLCHLPGLTPWRRHQAFRLPATWWANPTVIA